MNRTIVLERSVPVRCWHVVGQIAKAEKRPELMPVLLRAREADGTDAHDLTEHLLFESQSRRVVADRLLQIAHDYGLVKKKESEPGAWSTWPSGDPLRSLRPRAAWEELSAYEEIRGVEERDGVFALTEAGETAIDTEEVLVPKPGTWSIWTSDDPLLPSRILRIAPWEEPSAYEEIRGAGREDARQRSPGLLPDWLRDVAGTPIKPAAEGAAVRIDELQEKAEAVDGTLRLSWNVGEGRLQLTGTLEGKEVETELEAPPISPDQIWFLLLEEEALLRRWDIDGQQLHVSFDETGDTEREAMARDLEFEAPKIPGYGKFEPLTVRGVAITADSHAGAQSWAQWRLQARIRDYATSERYATWRKEAADPFNQYEVELPTRTELFDEVWNQTTSPEPRAWRLAAAEDWRL